MEVEYAASPRQLMEGHTSGVRYTFEIAITDAVRSRKTNKAVVRAVNGRTETLYHSVDTLWRITFEPVFGTKRDQMEEFLASTADGDGFSVLLYEGATAMDCERMDRGFSMTPFQLTGARLKDAFTVTIEVRQL